jgi:hypothetical protein
LLFVGVNAHAVRGASVFGAGFFWVLRVHGGAICIVIKGKGLRGEQFVSLSKQRGKNLALELGEDFGCRGSGSGGEGRRETPWWTVAWVWFYVNGRNVPVLVLIADIDWRRGAVGGVLGLKVFATRGRMTP